MNFDIQNGIKEMVKNSSSGGRKDALISDSLILEIIMQNSQDTIYFKDKDSKFIANSNAHLVQVGCESTQNMIGKSDFDFFPAEFAKKALLDEKEIMRTGTPILGIEEKLILPDGKVVWFSASKYPIHDEQGEVIGTWGTSRDITDFKNAQEELSQLNILLESNNMELQKLSDLDGLSKLYNQRKFYEVLENTIERYRFKQQYDEKAKFSVMMMDVDNFKHINDSYGHPVGDLVIKYIADILQNNKRIDDFCFRCGGDEFAMILIDTGIDSALFVAQRLRKIVEEGHFTYQKRPINITMSVGVQEFQVEDSTYQILEKVDKRLYISKNNGRNQVN